MISTKKKYFKFDIDQYIIVYILVAILTISYGSFGIYQMTLSKQYNNAVQILSLTFNIQNVGDIIKNDNKIKPYLTQSLYSDYGINSKQFTYYNFIKLHNSKTNVTVIDSSIHFNKGVIEYSLTNSYINSNRRFIMFYTIKHGKFTSINYYEIAGVM